MKHLYPCPVCGQPNESMGVLGNRAHYRCRSCGIAYSRVIRRKDSNVKLSRQACR
jgi:tRNA(Ile2) C34 agmatinyltransferase TiaS